MSTQALTVCDSCNTVIPDDSRDVAVAEFRIGSNDKHDFIVHQTCMTGMLEGICRRELFFPALGTVLTASPGEIGTPFAPAC